MIGHKNMKLVSRESGSLPLTGLKSCSFFYFALSLEQKLCLLWQYKLLYKLLAKSVEQRDLPVTAPIPIYRFDET